jgi:hypothetical protein
LGVVAATLPDDPGGERRRGRVRRVRARVVAVAPGEVVGARREILYKVIRWNRVVADRT